MANWKQVEREVAKMVAGERVPITGRIRGSAPDIAHRDYSIEVKHRKKLPDWIHDAVDQATQSQEAGHIFRLVVLHEERQPFKECYAITPLVDFHQFVQDTQESIWRLKLRIAELENAEPPEVE